MGTDLEVLATDEAGIHVDGTQGHRTTLFEVEIQVLHGNTCEKVERHGSNCFGFVPKSLVNSFPVNRDQPAARTTAWSIFQCSCGLHLGFNSLQ